MKQLAASPAKAWVPDLGMWEERLADGKWRYTVWMNGVVVEQVLTKQKRRGAKRMTGPVES